ncbi:hypothetical protein NFC81_03670 [Salinispirillum sp. LH 10-3-1]|uniref:Tetratricopeptide repeat protein n=1 Tax=Salinispirillum sp. LH 10-3-1 TaxID=2952525 RepID=A0AB38YHW7_9GAMM
MNEHEHSILILNEWFPVFLNQFGPNHPHVRFAHFLRGQNLSALAQDEEAVTSILSAIELYQNAIPLNDDSLEASYQILGRYYRQQASPEDTVHYWQLAAQLRADVHGVMDPDRGVYLNYIAALRLEQEDWDQAEMLYLEARNIFLHAPKEARFWVLFVDKALVDLYRARKQYIQAARYSASYNFRVATIGLLHL